MIGFSIGAVRGSVIENCASLVSHSGGRALLLVLLLFPKSKRTERSAYRQGDAED
jgi:hypothetical protein